MIKCNRKSWNRFIRCSYSLWMILDCLALKILASKTIFSLTIIVIMIEIFLLVEQFHTDLVTTLFLSLSRECTKNRTLLIVKVKTKLISCILRFSFQEQFFEWAQTKIYILSILFIQMSKILFQSHISSIIAK
jgi:hypothetical protein